MDITFVFIELGLSLLILLLAGKIKGYPSNKWRILYFAPIFIAVLFSFMVDFSFISVFVYLAAAVFLGWYYTEDLMIRRVIAVVAVLITGALALYLLTDPDYKTKNYYSDFNNGFDNMKAHYVLDKEKGIDWDELYAKYEPRFKDVQDRQDSAMNYRVWQEFVGEFYDGHVSYAMKDDDDMRDAFCKVYGNDYGLSLIRLSSGEYAAVNVEGCGNSFAIDKDADSLGLGEIKDRYIIKDADRSVLSNAGIKNGTIITKWDGKPIDDYLDDITFTLFACPDRDNEAFYKPLYVAGIGGETVDITFIDEGGNEKQVTAPKLGAYFPRLYDTIEKIDGGVKVTNLSWQEINENTALIRIDEMAYDSKTYEGTDYKAMTDKLRSEVEELKAKGIKTLIFDLRQNSGGSPYMVEGVAGLFAPEGEHISYYSAVINEDTASFDRGPDGKYIKNKELKYTGEDLWHDGKIVLLVNGETVSAGDDMTYMMGEYPNVTVVGFTSSNSSCQAVGSVSLDEGNLTFSAVPNLDNDGNVAIDTFTDHKGRVPFDEYIPFSSEAVTAIFDNGTDYQLDYVIKEL